MYFYFYFSDEKGEKRTAEQNVQHLYNNPSNCNDIGMLGHTLNGYYLVNSTESAGRFGVCIFVNLNFHLELTEVRKDKSWVINLFN